MSIETRIQAINDHLIDDYKVLRLAGADLTGVNKNIVNLKMSWKERLLYFMNNGTDEVWNNWDKVSGTGTTLSLNNTEEAPMSLTYKGNTSQEGTPTPESPQDIHVVSGDNSIEVVGKNLFDIGTSNSDYLQRTNVPSFLTVNDNTLSIVIQNYGETFFYRNKNLKDNGVFTVSLTSSIGYSRLFVRLRKLDDSGWMTSSDATISGLTYNQYFGDWYANMNSSGAGGTYQKTITIPNCLYWQIGFGWDSATYGGQTQTLTNIQLEKGSTATTYQPYQSASYSINLGDKELCKIGTYQDKIDKSSGKNLFDIKNFTLGTSNGITSTIDGDHLVLNGTASGTAYVNFVASNFNGTCTWGIRSDVALGNLQIQRTGAGVVNIAPSTTWNKSTLDSTNVTGGYLSIPSGTTLTNCKVYLYVGEGTLSFIDYEPYGKVWYLKKEIGKVVLNGSENWSINAGQGFIIPSTETTFSSRNTNVYDGYCNRFSFNKNSTTWVNDLTVGFNASNVFWLKYDSKLSLSITQWKEWVSNNNIEVSFPLATPTYEYITDTTLISQLEALKKSYEGQTNISQTNNDLAFELSVTALEVMS